MAEGKSNRGIAEDLVVPEPAVEKHVTSIFQKLGLGPTMSEHRRVLVVLTYVRHATTLDVAARPPWGTTTTPARPVSIAVCAPTPQRVRRGCTRDG
jgi:hypothetical protein